MRTQPWQTITLGLVTVFWLTACVSVPPASPTLDVRPTAEARELNIYNWDTYMDPAILTGFEQQQGIKINYSTYGSNEELLARLNAGPTDFDLVVPTNYMVTIMRNDNLLAPLDKDKIPNAKNVDPTFLNPVYDPGNRYCYPYQWGTLGIGYNRQRTGKEIASWADLFDPAFAGRVALLDDQRVSLGIVLLYLGYSPNTTDATQIGQARDFLIDHSAQIKTYALDTGQDLLADGEVDLTLEYSGDIFQLMLDDPDIRYVIPREGSIIWTDNICVPASAPHKDFAFTFINYLLDSKVGAALSNYTHYATPNQAALPFVNQADRDNPALYPPPDVQARLFLLSDVGSQSSSLYEAAWTQIMTKHSP